MDTDLIDRLTNTAAGDWQREAPVWLLAEHGHWLPQLDQKRLILHDTDEPYSRIRWQQVAAQARRTTLTLIGSGSEWQVLEIACALAGMPGMSWRSLASLDETNRRLVLHATAWAGGGRAWADRQFTPPNSPEISVELANHVLFHFGQGGYRPGSFTEQLLNTFAAADPMRAAQLREAFPAHGWAMHLAQNTEQGIAQLRVIASRS